MHGHGYEYGYWCRYTGTGTRTGTHLSHIESRQTPASTTPPVARQETRSRLIVRIKRVESTSGRFTKPINNGKRPCSVAPLCGYTYSEFTLVFLYCSGSGSGTDVGGQPPCKKGNQAICAGLVNDEDSDCDPADSGSWFWRVMKASMPFQVAIVALICVVCLLEPSCCDSINNLNLSLTPQLRYVRGPPPV